MEIKQLDYDEYAGRKYHASIHSDKYLSIEPTDKGFSMEWLKIPEELKMSIDDDMLSDWLDDPVAYGAFEGDTLVGFVEGFLEKWNNRYRISNICVFDEDARNSGIGTRLFKAIMGEAVKSGARMAVLETQNFNYKAISFYKKNGFEIIGFDLYAYSNNGPKERNIRIEMGKAL